MKIVHLAFATLALTSAAAFGLGRWSSTEAPPPVHPEEELEMDLSRVSPPRWRHSVEFARDTADADSVRAMALGMLEDGGSDALRGEALVLLGWVAQPADAVLLEIFLDDPSAQLRLAAVQALGAAGGDRAVDTLLSLHESRDRELGRGVVLALGRTGHPRALPALADEIRGGSHAGAAAHALALFGTEEAADLLTDAFHSSDHTAASPLATALASFPAEVAGAREALYLGVISGHPAQRSAAMQALAEVGDPDLFPRLAELARTGTATTRVEAASALGKLRDPRAIPVLEELAADGPFVARSMAIASLGELDHPDATDALLDLIEIGSPGIAAAAVRALPRADDPGAVAVLLWASDEAAAEVRVEATSRLLTEPWPRGEVPLEVVELAREQLATPTARFGSSEAFALLLEHGDDADRAFVAETLSTCSARQRASAVSALERDPSPLAEELLLGLIDDPDLSVQQAAIAAVQRRGPGLEALLEDKLLTRLQDGGFGGWGVVEQALAELGSPAALDALEERARHGTAQEARHALSALAFTGGSEHTRRIASLLDAEDDPESRARLYEFVLLGNGGDVESYAHQALAEGDPRLEQLAVDALARIGTPASRDMLVELYDDGESSTRVAALHALAQIGGEHAEQRLVEALDDGELASSALSGLQQLGTPRARESIAQLARSSDDVYLRQQALSFLAWDHTPDSEQILLRAVEDESSEVRMAAVGALQTMGTTTAAEAMVGLLDADPDDGQAWIEARQAAWALQGMGGAVAREHQRAIEAVLGDDAGMDTGLLGWEDELIW